MNVFNPITSLCNTGHLQILLSVSEINFILRKIHVRLRYRMPGKQLKFEKMMIHLHLTSTSYIYVLHLNVLRLNFYQNKGKS